MWRSFANWCFVSVPVLCNRVVERNFCKLFRFSDFLLSRNRGGEGCLCKGTLDQIFSKNHATNSILVSNEGLRGTEAPHRTFVKEPWVEFFEKKFGLRLCKL